MKTKVKFKFKKLKKGSKMVRCISQTGWFSLSHMDKQKPAEVITGEIWIYKETKESITLFGTYSYDDER